jgi:hypothetical protein
MDAQIPGALSGLKGITFHYMLYNEEVVGIHFVYEVYGVLPASWGMRACAYPGS